MGALKFAILGAGFWSNYQLAAWNEVKGAHCIAIYNRTRDKAEALARHHNIPRVYDDAEELLRSENLDFVDIITDVATHAQFVQMAAAYKIPVICQKPMARSPGEAERMVQVCERARVPFAVHENWRWQAPIRALKTVLASGAIGKPFRARIDMLSGFPVFANQPFLRELEHFIVADLGSHTLDTGRFLFGEAQSLYCRAQRVHSDIEGEDAATIILNMENGVTVTINMAYAENFLEREFFPQTLAFVEGARGSVELAGDYWVRVTTKKGTHSRRHPPARFSWADPAYEVVQASIVPCNQDILRSLQTGKPAETSGADNLRTVRLVFSAYQSAARNQVVRISA